MTNDAAVGVTAAVIICLTAWFLAKQAGKRVERLTKNSITSGVSVLYAETAVRLLIAVSGVILVFILFGNNKGIPCAVAIVPLYFLETVLSVSLNRRKKR